MSEKSTYPIIDKNTTSAKDAIQREIDKSDELENEVNKQREKLKQEIDELSDNIILSCRQLKQANNDITDTYTKNQEEKRQNLEKHVQQFKTVLQEGSLVEIYDLRNEIRDLSIGSIPDTPTLRTATFVPNRNPHDNLKQSIGTLTINQPDSQNRHWQSDCQQDSSRQHQSDGHLESSKQHQSGGHQESSKQHQSDGHLESSKQHQSGGHQESSKQHQSDCQQESSIQHQSGGHQESSKQHQSDCQQESSKQHSGGHQETSKLYNSYGHHQTQQSAYQPRRSSTQHSHSATKPKPNYSARVITEFKPPWGITCISTTIDEKIYVSHFTDSTVKLLNKKGEVQQEIRYRVRINDITISPLTQHVWACSEQDRSVTEYANFPSYNPVLRFYAEKQPYCLCATADNYILIGMPEKITKYTTDGNILLSVKLSWSGLYGCGTSAKIAECSVTRNVAMRCDGRILVMNKNLQERFSYKGHIPVEYKYNIKRRVQQDDFVPFDVRFDRMGNIVISDCARGCVHLLSGAGDYLSLIFSVDTMLMCFDIDVKNVLWVVTAKQEVKLVKYIDV